MVKRLITFILLLTLAIGPLGCKEEEPNMSEEPVQTMEEMQEEAEEEITEENLDEEVDKMEEEINTDIE